ncbi:Hypothetical predicted protein, partial [Mytilus galloprovincialis]
MIHILDGQWAEWNEWSECTISCGKGYKLRNRSCTDPSPQFGGELCNGNETETDICNTNDCPVDGNWSTWGGWQECSVTCGGGDKTRNRTCTDPIPQYSGEDCHGNDTEVAICNAILCPIDGNWSDWSEWHECSVICGEGNQTRNRTCNNPEPQLGGEYCDGNDLEDIKCYKIACPIDGIWSNWNEWTACSLSCGGGSQSRNRTCNEPEPEYGGIHCSGNITDEQNCNGDPCPINGNWTEWSDWSDCDVSCGGGIQTKYRNCTNPVPQFGGGDCFGNNTEISVCNSKYCPIDGHWTTWSAWDECSVSCGGGILYRNRSCSNPDPQFGGKDCRENATDTKSCNDNKCPIDGNWTNWSEWNICSKSCGGGFMLRNRTCSNPEPLFGGEDCIGNNTDDNFCNTNECPVDGNWTDWSVWSTCSHSCGRGFQSRNRTCSNPVPQFGGKECLGNATDDDICNLHNCPVDGNWSGWSEWEACSFTCGGGIKTRNRTCSNPEPQFGGNQCLGNDTFISNCADDPCPINGNWTDWSYWNECSVTCGGGIKVRERNCSNPIPQYGGESCLGNSTNTELCNEDPCPIEGNWSGWSKWKECSATCGGGIKTRNRTCSNPEPQFGGNNCTGNDTIIVNCADIPCPINGNWTEWSPWNECSVTCGGGIKFRERNCSNPDPQYGGDPCFGNTTNIETCNEDPCPIDGNWSDWSEWEECSATCGGGLKPRNRTCSKPEPQFGGKYCTGNDTNTSYCAENPCPIHGNWTEWSSWNACSVTCGGGMKFRDRNCSNPDPQYGGDHCFGNTTNIETCNADPCP